MKQVEINGLLWDTEPLVVEGCNLFNYGRAEYIARCAGKRLPTPEEFNALMSTGCVWQDTAKGVQVADGKLLIPTYKSGRYECAPGVMEQLGLYWLHNAEQYFNYTRYAYLSPGHACTNYETYIYDRLSLILVQDIKSLDGLTRTPCYPDRFTVGSRPVKVAGLFWDEQNLEVNGKRLFTRWEAIKAAKSSGKRLPTRKEILKLFKVLPRWSKYDKGFWFGEDALFLPQTRDMAMIYAIQGGNVRYEYEFVSQIQRYNWCLEFDFEDFVNYEGADVRCVQL